MLTVSVMQPQRPVRNIRVRVDENFPPALPVPKTIHQRNKSSPALSTMLGAAGLKAPAKRTAFGDVSNTINGVRPSKDDGAIPVKQGLQVNDKVVPLVAERKTTTFLKQASRPYSVSNLKGLLTGVSGVANTELPLKPAPIETNTLANSRKTLIKRPATTIFKDVTLPASQEPALKSLTEAQSATTFIPLTKPLPLPEVSLTAKATDDAHSQPNTASDVSHDDTEKSSMQPGITSSDAEVSAALRSDGIYIDEEGNVRVYEEVEETEPEHQNQTNYLTSKPTSTSVAKAEMHHAPRAEPLAASHASDANRLSYGQLPHRAEPEEYWEEEEEEDENYEEEGYVTARSFRSRGENTTGGATTILFPQLNQKIKREIEAAKQLVEAERTPEEIEDECFDTSMVAEYGDEIFDYMRDLEVSYWSLAYIVQC
jgi:hypothetical protein